MTQSVAAETRPEPTIEGTIRAERPRLLHFIRSRVRIAEDAEDIVQDVFHQLVATDVVVESIEKLTSWLFTVARNRIIDWYRKRRRDTPAEHAAGAMHDGDELPEDRLFDPIDAPDAALFRSAVWDELTDALEDLPAAQRDIFTMHELEGRSFKEISAETGVPVATLLSRKRYAVAYLRTRLQDLYDDLNNL